MKIEDLKKVRTILASLTMSYTLLLTGCGENKIKLDRTNTIYEEDTILEPFLMKI